MAIVAVVTTVDTRDRALAMARILVERRLAACVQLTNIESVYRWDGAVQLDHEVRLLVKTTSDRIPEVEAAIKAMHSYELPAIHAVEIDYVEMMYGEWVTRSTLPE